MPGVVFGDEGAIEEQRCTTADQCTNTCGDRELHVHWWEGRSGDEGEVNDVGG